MSIANCTREQYLQFKSFGKVYRILRLWPSSGQMSWFLEVFEAENLSRIPLKPSRKSNLNREQTLTEPNLSYSTCSIMSYMANVFYLLKKYLGVEKKFRSCIPTKSSGYNCDKLSMKSLLNTRAIYSPWISQKSMQIPRDKCWIELTDIIL